MLASLVVTGVASATDPQGHLSGNAGLFTDVGITFLSIDTTVSDGELEYVAQKNDKSDDCDGDIGSVLVGHVGGSTSTFDVACAHYTGKGMAFYFLDTDLDPDTYVVVYIVDGVSDRIYVGTTTDPALATKWVDRGWQGSGAKHLSHDFSQVSFEGDYTVTAS